ncbi:MAG: precorrin-6y C5,15-methyltransferase (decarboxylating) subunit CbiE [Clostridium sp.]
MIYIVGIGPGNKDYMLQKALNIMEECDLIVGFKRAVESVDFISTHKECMRTLYDLDKYIVEDNNKDIAVIASGDPTFYGITNYIKNKSKIDFEIIPGISSFQYMTCKTKLPWNNAYLGSLHGRKENFIEDVKNNDLSIWLTDRENNPAVLCKMLEDEKIDCTVLIGENLSYNNEFIYEGRPEEFVEKEFASLNIFMVKKNGNE